MKTQKGLPGIFFRFIIWALMRTIYRMTVTGSSNVPARGGALLVSNSISYIDHAIILASLDRPVKFFVGRGFYSHPLLSPLTKSLNAIPIDRNDSPKALARALSEAHVAIQNGELVCIFAEGDVTRTGNMLPFGRGVEFIMKGLDAPIIPLYLDRIWGSTFSFVDGKMKWMLPKVLPYPITVSFGKPMAPSAQAGEVRLAVQELSVDAFKLRGESQKQLHITFLHEARRHPFKFCMADSLGTELNYSKTLAGMLTLARKLFNAGDREYDEKVGILLPTSCGAVLANGAVLFAGKVPVNLNYTSSGESLASAVEQCGMKRILTSRAFIQKLNIEPDPRMIYLEDVKASISKASRIMNYLAVLLLPAALLARVYARGDTNNVDALSSIKFSSGSTGEPKGVMLTHQNISSNIEGAYQVFNLKSRDIFMGVLPFFHSFGYMATLWLPLTTGTAVVYHTNPLEAATVGEMIRKYKASILIGTPTFLANYTRKCEKEQFASLRFVVAGAEKFKQNIVEAFYAKFGVPPFEGYGCTELSPVVSLGISSYIHPQGKFVQVGNKPGTVGHPLPGVAAKIVDPDTFEKLPSGAEGLLLIKGPNVMKGYFRDPDKTAEVIKDGWYVTGDIASIDEDGFIAITDRLSRFSKIAGEMVPHVKIEEKIQEILGAEVPVCAVTSVSDDRKGEKLVVLHKPGIDVDKLCASLAVCGLPNLWLPKKDCFIQVDEIPLLGTGKLDLKAVKTSAERYFNK